ncbi:Type-1A pilin [Delftia tsuruhatensis]|nr:Type-1A pilin [Delftia tsuruhatensis]CAC9676718.1 Type-1A pilin [Delftia tsuruhatensis]
MKNLVLKSSIATLALMTMGAANAQVVSIGKVNFTGTIRHNTCSIKSDSVNQTVSFGTISPSEFTGTGTTGNSRKPFKINLEKCSTGAAPGGGNYPSQAYVKFYGTNVDTTTGRLKLTPGSNAATGLQVRINNSSGTEMQLQQPTAQSQGSTVISLSPGDNNSLDFSAEYIATGPNVGGGAGNTEVNFEMVYP